MEAYGVIVGKALYEQKFDLVQAVSDIPSFKPTGLNVKPTNDVSKRLIACLDVAEGRVVKGEQYKNFRDAGDPVAVSKAYSDMGIDELSLLDIKATVENREAMYKLIEDVAREINIPIMVAGGVKTVENVKSLLNAGADKVGIETAAVLDPDLIEAAAQEFGSQCIVISITPKRQGDSWELYIKGGREATGIDAIEFCREMERRGAGELLVNSLDRDGTKAGYDLKLLRAITKAVNIPVIASSGAGKLEHFLEAFVEGKADAALAASLFHYREIEVPELKKYLADNGMPVRM
ncbi:MAG: imidazole glycerol phosphate synthase subunit HisF [Parcubacteria group bacterium]|nr:imidazole glycerol phosphate synthase subunit HisF [Parcubacteria group bacterium]